MGYLSNWQTPRQSFVEAFFLALVDGLAAKPQLLACIDREPVHEDIVGQVSRWHRSRNKRFLEGLAWFVDKRSKRTTKTIKFWSIGLFKIDVSSAHAFSYELNELKKFLLTHCITGSDGGSTLQKEPAHASVFQSRLVGQATQEQGRG